MKTQAYVSVVKFLMLVSFFLISPFFSHAQLSSEKMRIGIFDSRCVAIAYGRTDFMQYIGELRQEHEKAQSEGNEERVKELEKLGPTLQFIMHQQGFSTGSVRNIMQLIRDQIPEIAKANDVSMILSKWELCFSDDTVELIDLTDQIVALFHPDEQTLGIVQQMKSIEPVPIEAISE